MGVDDAARLGPRLVYLAVDRQLVGVAHGGAGGHAPPVEVDAHHIFLAREQQPALAVAAAADEHLVATRDARADVASSLLDQPRHRQDAAGQRYLASQL